MAEQSLPCLQGREKPGLQRAGCQVIKAGVRVTPSLGPCAAIAALTVSGLASDEFIFEGFLPAKSTALESKLETLCEQTCTLIFYESTHRIIDSLESMEKYLAMKEK